MSWIISYVHWSYKNNLIFNVITFLSSISFLYQQSYLNEVSPKCNVRFFKKIQIWIFSQKPLLICFFVQYRS